MYGQAGTGKSHLVCGGMSEGDPLGLLPRTIIEVMNLRDQLGLVVALSMFTVNGDVVTDLLPVPSLRSCDVDPSLFCSRILSDKACVHDVLLTDRVQALELVQQAVRQTQRKVAGMEQGPCVSLCLCRGLIATPVPGCHAGSSYKRACFAFVFR